MTASAPRVRGAAVSSEPDYRHDGVLGNRATRLLGWPGSRCHC